MKTPMIRLRTLSLAVFLITVGILPLLTCGGECSVGEVVDKEVTS